MRIHTACIHGLINPRTGKFMDVWRAWDDDKGADASRYGTGATEEEAIADLVAQEEEAA